METQTTFRLPAPLARLLGQRAKARGVSKSQLVREALEGYLHPGPSAHQTTMVRERVASYLGSLNLNAASSASDPFAAMIRERNWRK